jgi:phenylpyruvate tautomerase PptA (4-oxalocrotonate tautomerase family)
MPLITVSYATPRVSPSLKADIASVVSELTAKILHKDPQVTAIIVKSVGANDWFAGGKSLAEQQLASYWTSMSQRAPTPRTRRPPISPPCSSEWPGFWARCITRRICMSTR